MIDFILFVVGMVVLIAVLCPVYFVALGLGMKFGILRDEDNWWK